MKKRYQARGVATSMILIGILVIALPSPELLSGDGDWIARGIGLTVVGAYGMFCILRLARAGVEVDSRGIRVVNAFSTKSFAWSEIEAFSWSRSGVLPRVTVVLKNETVIPILGLPVGGAGLGRSSTARALDELNQLLASHAPSRPS